ncbi:hypothetical protein LPJ79_001275 [Coemansia sp. RSA 1821]|nr:hypothetical protein LPJ79_001275 [Coemansia sp. RSA 1821]
MSNKGKQPRVKGNLKPTSSSRAANLVGENTAAINAFKANPALAFAQLSRTAATSSAGSKKPDRSHSGDDKSGSSTPLSSELSQIDANLACQMKRLGKPDARTRMRALVELRGYVEEYTWETGLDKMLLAWPRCYGKHIFDQNHRVRALVAQIHADLVMKVGRHLAAHLKTIIGPWLASFFDPNRDIARVSRSAFESVFSEKKRKQVFSYCYTELVTYCNQTISNETLSLPASFRSADDETIRNRYSQIVGSSFGVLSLVVENTEEVMEHQNDFFMLLNDKQLLAMVSDSSSFIRRNVYRLIRAIMLKCPQLVGNSHANLSRALLKHGFADSDPTIHGDMWDAVLLTTKNYPDIWLASGEVDKKAVERVFEFLRTKCRLSPTISYPSILALLANLPQQVLNQPQFPQKFEEALWQGGSKPNEGNRGATEQESVALVTAICECSAFLWARTLKTAEVDKEASKQVDKLWHYYLQHPDVASELSKPIVKLYCQIESLAAKHNSDLLTRIWAQSSWFALQRLSDGAVAPIVSLVSQIAELDASLHKELVANARKLLTACCQLAIQSPDNDTARALIQTLSQQAPDVVFDGGFAEKFSTRLEQAGTTDDAVQLVLSKAYHVAQDTGSAEKAAASIDPYVAELLNDGNMTTATDLLAALPESEVSRVNGWNNVHLPQTETMLVKLLPSMHSEDTAALLSTSAPSVALAQLYKQALVLYFNRTKLISEVAIQKIFKWTEAVFMAVYQAQWTDSTEEANLIAWIKTAHEALSSWITLARNEQAGARFVRYWLEVSGHHGRSALGLLFDFAVSTDTSQSADTSSAELVSTKLAAQGRRAWSAIEAQITKLHLGSELAIALSKSIMEQVNDLNSDKSAADLARLASAVYKRICPQDDTTTMQMLVNRWLFSVKLDSEKQLGLAGAAGVSGLWQASLSDTDMVDAPLHTLTHWHAAVNGPQATRLEYGHNGLSQFARFAVFAIGFVEQAGGVTVFSSSNSEQVEKFIMHMVLAYVLLREGLLLADSSNEWWIGLSDADAVFANASAVIDVESISDLAQVDSANSAIQQVVMDLLSLTAVHEQSLSEDAGEIKTPCDPAQWLSTMSASVAQASGVSTLWDTLVERSHCSVESPWQMVLGRIIEWCVWVDPPQAASIETTVAAMLARQLAEHKLTSIAATATATAVARAVRLRDCCSRAPAMRSALLDSVTRTARAIEGGDLSHITAELELLAELIPVHEAALDTTLTANITRILLALSNQLADKDDGAMEAALGGLLVLRRLCLSTSALEDQGAVELVRMCLKWTKLQKPHWADAPLLAAVGRAIDSLAQAPGAEEAAAVALRLAGEQLTELCVLSERPVAAGALAVAVLAERGLADVPAFDSMYPVLASATPALNAALVRLVLAEPSRADYMSGNVELLVRLATSASKRLTDLRVSSTDLEAAVEADAFTCNETVRLLTALLLLTQFAKAMDELPVYEDLLAQVTGQRVLDAAMPWVCGLLGLSSGSGSPAIEAKLWDATELDWQLWSSEISRGPQSFHSLSLLAFHVLFGIAEHLPQALRSWWAGLPPSQRATGAAVERFIAAHISQPLVSRQMDRIREQQEGDSKHEWALEQMLAEYDDAQVRAATWKVNISYTVDDSTLELLVRMPTTYPLAPAVFETVHRVAVSEKRWRGWVVAAQAKLARCPRIDAVCAQIVGNIGAHFAGVEDCAICYSAVGAMDNSLPNRQCKTCKNKFHRMCLFKWFNTSNQSTCPLCRNLF